MYGMPVDPKQAARTSGHNGEIVSYCLLGCKQQFDRDPEQYIAGQVVQR